MTNNHKYHPPRWATKFLHWYCPDVLLEEIEGDLYENFFRNLEEKSIRRARLRYGIDAVRFCNFTTFRKARSLQSTIPYSDHQPNILPMFRNYLKIAFRSLAKQKLYAFINMFGLATGIACALLIYLFVQDELSFDRFHEKGDRIYRVNFYEKNITTGIEEITTTQPYPLGPALLTDLPEIENFVRFSNSINRYIKKEDNIFQEEFKYADSTLFQVFSFPLLYGDPKTALSEPSNIAISQSAAEQYFGNIVNPVGQQLLVRTKDGFEAFTVTAVFEDIPANSSVSSDFFIPIFGKYVEQSYPYFNNPKYNLWHASAFRTYVLLNVSASAGALQDKLPGFRTKYYPTEAEYFIEEEKESGNKLTRAFQLQPLYDVHLNPNVKYGLTPPSDPVYSYILAAIALVILAIACINFTTLSIGQSASRGKEVGMRKVIGARRSQLIGQFISEAFLMSCLATGLGVGVAWLGLPVFNMLSEKELVFGTLFQFQSVAVLIAMMVVTGCVAGFYPALVLSGFSPLLAFKNKIKLGGANFFTQSLVTVQFALPVAFFIIVMVMADQLHFMRNKNLGFRGEQMLVIGNNAPDQEQAFQRFVNEAQSQTGIIAITAANASFTRGGIVFSIRDENNHQLGVHTFNVQANYIETMGMELLEGRNFNPALSSDSSEAIIVNEAFVKAFGWNDPVGKQVKDFGDKLVIGVVKDFHFQSLESPVEPAMLILDDEVNFILVRLSPENMAENVDKLSEIWQEVATDTPFQYSFLDEDMNSLYKSEERWSAILKYTSGLSMLIACMGLFGITALTVVGRTKEIGIRKVLGATVQNIVLLVFNDFNRLVLLAFLVACPLAYYIAHTWLENFAYRVEVNPLVFVIAGVGVLLVAFLTVSYNASKAALTNPVNALRDE